MKGKPFWIGIAGLFSATAIAGSMGGENAVYNDPGAATCGKVITLSLGPAWYNNRGEGQRNFFPSIILPPGYTHTYVPTQTSGVLGSGELFFALTSTLNYLFSGQLGLAVGYSGNGTQDGRLYTERDSGRYTYSYKLSNARIGAKGKIVTEWSHWVKPYISGSAGVGFNRAWDYTTTHSIFGISSRPSFDESTEVAFTYTAGIGLQGNIAPNWQIGVGYEFSDWGKNSLTTPSLNLPDVPTPTVPYVYRALHASTFYTHQLQISLSYLM